MQQIYRTLLEARFSLIGAAHHPFDLRLRIAVGMDSGWLAPPRPVALEASARKTGVTKHTQFSVATDAIAFDDR